MTKARCTAEHGARVAAMVVLGSTKLATACHDRQLRVWCLRTFKLLQALPDAHDTPLQVHLCTAEILGDHKQK